jgi:predicted NAD-dependent protein-ADP-ribosyltransferase YbiA (DUF1768 family)
MSENVLVHDDPQTPILFYKLREPYGCFSNFSRHPVKVFNHDFPTSEHAYQAMKFFPTSQTTFNEILKAPTPRIAADTGRSSGWITPRWESAEEKDLREVLDPINMTHLLGAMVDDGRGATLGIERYKDAIMFRVCFAKAQQNAEVEQTLRYTGKRGIVENSDKDSYWGWGADRMGVNKLGKVLMLVRESLPPA